ncbi:TPA: DUF551 domain-containing protein [Klebsiella michiganensis]|nr:DUF551 domain-containing protein [Klebsiella michiganensis]
MTKSTITREQLEEWVAQFDEDGGCDATDRQLEALIRQSLAAMESEPVRNPVLSYADSYRDMAKQGVESVPIWSVITDLERNIAPLYRHAQQPVVPQDVLEALQKVARIRLNLNDFDGDRRGIADCLGDAEEALIEVVNRRAAMLHGAENAESRCGNSPVIPGRWIPVSERMPENKPGCYKYLVFETLNNRVNNDYWNVPDKGDEAFTPFWNYYGEHVTHWMPLPAAPQEVKGE